jgi:hypothetical protein
MQATIMALWAIFFLSSTEWSAVKAWKVKTAVRGLTMINTEVKA